MSDIDLSDSDLWPEFEDDNIEIQVVRTSAPAVLAEVPHSYFWEFIHNVVAHPLMSLTFNSGWSLRFHDWTGDKAWG